MEVIKKKINGHEDHYVLYMYDSDEKIYFAYIGKTDEDLLVLLNKSPDERFQVMDTFITYIEDQILDHSLVSTYDKLTESVVKCTNDKIAEFDRDLKQLDKAYNDSKAELDKKAQKIKNDLSDAIDIKSIEEIDMQSPLGRHIIEALRERLGGIPGPQPMGGLIPHGKAFQMKARVDKDGKISFTPDDINNMMMDILSNIIVAEVKSGRKLSEAISDVDNIINTLSVNAAKLTLRFKE
ncbi:hypothetical protein [Oribacterium sp. WCC10]|uniref:hypothetical protein n=1 Tax=Oribacterium sp. WCC10 TaxID=1855343 RepID=UPI0008E03FB6|nr:hypothetical protein [Oribacterium sp. WCC10]SFG75299.1 hypothetical protein SAMN05216356_12427 [Oribacterium sp. WCC10]